MTAKKLPIVQQTAPERIWLAVADDAYYADKPFPDAEEVCWSSDAPLEVCVPYLRADLAALAPEASGADYVMVPREPTPEMVRASFRVDLSYMPGQESADRAAVYRAMLAAAPINPAPPTRTPADESGADLADLIERLGCIRASMQYGSPNDAALAEAMHRLTQPATQGEGEGLPSAQGWLDSHCSVASKDWQRGWDAAREALDAARRARGESNEG